VGEIPWGFDSPSEYQMKRVPLTVDELFALEPGDTFRVYWAKDDDPNDVRLNYETLEISDMDEETIWASDDYIWSRKDFVGSSNCLNTSRGYAYFYRP
jgi:hypothetical protein